TASPNADRHRGCGNRVWRDNTVRPCPAVAAVRPPTPALAATNPHDRRRWHARLADRPPDAHRLFRRGRRRRQPGPGAGAMAPTGGSRGTPRRSGTVCEQRPACRHHAPGPVVSRPHAPGPGRVHQQTPPCLAPVTAIARLELCSGYVQSAFFSRGRITQMEGMVIRLRKRDKSETLTFEVSI